jgi:predicted acetyltransferase
MTMELVWPAEAHLDSYVEALRRGWSPDNVRPAETIREQLAQIEADPAAFLASLVDLEARGGEINFPDGSTRPRLPGYRKWMWDGEFCGSIGFRWANGTAELPEYVLGHIGYAVVPWKSGRGYATRALALLLPEARGLGLAYVDLTTDLDNIASQRVITANGGVLLGQFTKSSEYAGGEGLRYRIHLV